ncbi:hypothetical protein ACI8AK_11560 [Geodermatophilus sp. SYSU D00867]
MLTFLDDQVASRCDGSPTGGPDCLVIDEKPERLAQGLRDVCWVASFTLTHPDPGQPAVGPNGQVARGTTVTVQTKCIEVFGAMRGKTLTEFDAELTRRCGDSANTAGCLLVTESPPVDPAERSTCTVDTLAYTPEETAVPGQIAVLERGTVVTVVTLCGG